MNNIKSRTSWNSQDFQTSRHFRASQASCTSQRLSEKVQKKRYLNTFFLSFREFRNSYGTKFFASDPPEDDIVEEEVVTHVVGKKPLLGKVWKTETGDIVRYRCYSYGIEYKIGDPVFIESQRPEQPFHICCIQVS